MYNILVVDDSALMRKVICDIINADSDFRVVDVSADGEDAYNKIKNNSFDIVILDMILPKMMGEQVVEKLYEEHIAFNVILISSSVKEDADSTVRAMECGALDFVVKPNRTTAENKDEFSSALLKSMHQVASSVVSKKKTGQTTSAVSSLRDRLNSTSRNDYGARSQRADAFSSAGTKTAGTVARPTKPTITTPSKSIKGKKIIALACSTGGPQALHTFVPMLPATLKYPLVLVQHMPEGFTASLASRLNQISEINVKEAEEGEFFEPGCVYITPGGKHMEICENASHEAYCHLNDGPPVNSLKPCADVMYQSLADSSYEEIICVVLTGMGADGSQGIEYLSKHKKTYVISQEASTCVVYGMPKAVEQRGLSDEVVPLKSVADSIVKKLGGL